MFWFIQLLAFFDKVIVIIISFALNTKTLRENPQNSRIFAYSDQVLLYFKMLIQGIRKYLNYFETMTGAIIRAFHINAYHFNKISRSLLTLYMFPVLFCFRKSAVVSINAHAHVQLHNYASMLNILDTPLAILFRLVKRARAHQLSVARGRVGLCVQTWLVLRDSRAETFRLVGFEDCACTNTRKRKSPQLGSYGNALTDEH